LDHIGGNINNLLILVLNELLAAAMSRPRKKAVRVPIIPVATLITPFV
jgi:hypothetical protein